MRNGVGRCIIFCTDLSVRAYTHAFIFACVNAEKRAREGCGKMWEMGNGVMEKQQKQL